MAYCGFLTRFTRQFQSLLDTVKGKYSIAENFVLELLARTDFDITVYNHELGRLCRANHAKPIRSNVTKRDLDWDGLHLLLDGREVLTNDIHQTITRYGRITKPHSYPRTMCPSCTNVRKRKAKKKEEEVKTCEKKEGKLENKHHHPAPYRCHQQVKKMSKRQQFKIFGGDSYKQVGWVAMQKPMDVVAKIPIPAHQPLKLHIQPNKKTLDFTPPPVYINRKKTGKKKKRRKKRIKKHRVPPEKTTGKLNIV